MTLDALCVIPFRRPHADVLLKFLYVKVVGRLGVDPPHSEQFAPSVGQTGPTRAYEGKFSVPGYKSSPDLTGKKMSVMRGNRVRTTRRKGVNPKVIIGDFTIGSSALHCI